MIFRFCLSALLLIVLSGCAEDTGVKLEEDQLSRLVAREKSFEWVGYGFSGDVTFANEGTVHLKVHGVGEDDGRWEQEGAQLCVQFIRAIRGARRCAEVMRLSDGSYEARAPDADLRLGIFSPQRKRP